MEKIIKQLQLTKEKYYETHLTIINSIFPDNLITLRSGREVSSRLTPMEIKFLAAVMSLEGTLSEQEYRFGSTARKIIKDRLDISDAGVTNYISDLKDKGFLIEKEELESKKKKKIDILGILLPEKEQQLYMFKLINLN